MSDCEQGRREREGITMGEEVCCYHLVRVLHYISRYIGDLLCSCHMSRLQSQKWCAREISGPCNYTHYTNGPYQNTKLVGI